MSGAVSICSPGVYLFFNIIMVPDFVLVFYHASAQAVECQPLKKASYKYTTCIWSAIAGSSAQINPSLAIALTTRFASSLVTLIIPSGFTAREVTDQTSRPVSASKRLVSIAASVDEVTSTG